MHGRSFDLTNRQYFLTTLTCIALIGASGCRNETAPQVQTSTSQSSTAAASSTTAAPVPYDLQFIDMMSKHHRGAIDMAKMAQGKVRNPGLKALVKSIPVDQQKEIDQMKSWRDQWYPGAAMADNGTMPGMSSGMNMDMTRMQSMKAGPDFDGMFIDMMVPHHESAIAMSRDAIDKAQHPEIKALAQQIIDAQTKEIDQMKRWRAAIAKDSSSHKR